MSRQNQNSITVLDAKAHNIIQLRKTNAIVSDDHFQTVKEKLSVQKVLWNFEIKSYHSSVKKVDGSKNRVVAQNLRVYQ